MDLPFLIQNGSCNAFGCVPFLLYNVSGSVMYGK